MNTTSPSVILEHPREAWLAKAADYVALTRPKIAALELSTVAAAALAAGWTTGATLVVLHTLLGTALLAASASALNQWLERRADALMPRTADRPLPAARLSEGEVLAFGGASFVLGIAELWMATDALVLLLGCLTWSIYVWIYTPLKSRTSHNTAVGAVAGALPVLMGTAAVGQPFTLLSAALFMLVFLWQFPHFMAIAWLYRKQYARAGMKMLTVLDESGKRAGAQAVSAATALVPTALVPAAILMADPRWMAVSLILSTMQLAAAAWFLMRSSDHAARWLLRASLVYLPAQLFLVAILPL